MSERISWAVKVMWLHGMSVKGIATLSGRTKGSVRGIVHRAFADEPREAMSLERRQQLLDELAAVRSEDSKMALRYFTAGPIAAAPAAANIVLSERAKPQQSAILPSAPKPDPQTQTAKKKSRHREQQERLHREKLEREAKAEREAGGNRKRGFDGAALEWLHATKILADPEDKSVDAQPKGPDGMMSHERRKQAGLALRACIEESRVGGMSSVDFEREVRGGGAALGIAWWRLMSLDSLGSIRRALNTRDYEMLEAIVDRDEMPWEAVKSTVARKFLYEAIRRSLDVVACLWGMMTAGEFEKRWEYRLPPIEGLDPDDARDMSRMARELIREGMRTS